MNSGHDQTGNADGQESAPDHNQSVDWEKRYKDLQSHFDKTRVSLEQENDRLRKSATVFTPPKTEEELEVFKKENPDWMGVIETVAHQIASNSLKPIQEDLMKTKEQRAIAELRQAHPDFADIVNSEDFKQWADEQGPDVQEWLNEKYDASKVIRALNFYKAMRQPQSPQPTQRPASQAATLVSTRGSAVTPETSNAPKSFTRAQINAMHPSEYEKNYDAIMQAYQLGLIK